MKLLFFFCVAITVLSLLLVASREAVINADDKNKLYESADRLLWRTNLNCLSNRTVCQTDEQCQACGSRGPTYLCIGGSCKMDQRLVSTPCSNEKGGFIVVQPAPELNSYFERCVCLFPEYFVGAGCETTNPMIRGVIDKDVNLLKDSIRPDRDVSCSADEFKLIFDGVFVVCLNDRYEFFFQLN